MQCERWVWSLAQGWQVEGARLHAPPQLLLWFSTLRRADSQPLAEALRTLYPGAQVAGCSSATTAMEREVSDEGAVALAIHLERSSVVAQRAGVARAEDSFEAGLGLGRSLQAYPDLAFVLVFSDGLHVNGSRLLDGLYRGLGRPVPVAGGLAGDGARFVETWTCLDGELRTDEVVAVGVCSRDLHVSTTPICGWEPFGPRRTITRSSGHVLHELDGSPALDLYTRYLGEDADGLPGSALRYPLQVWPPGEPERAVVRTALGVDPEARTLTLAGDVPEGWCAQLMRGHQLRLVEGAEEGAQRTAGTLRDGAGRVVPPQLALGVSCAGRRIVMHQRTGDEIDAVKQVLGDSVPVIGFYSHGELAPGSEGGISCLHNQTLSVTLLTEAQAPEGAA